MKKLLLHLLFFCPLLVLSQKQYPAEVNSVLKQTPKNRAELEKALDYFIRQGDTLKIKAIFFLIANMDIHYSWSYYWADNLGRQIQFNELEHPDFGTSLKVIEDIKKNTSNVHAVPIKYRDIDSVKSDLLIDNVERAFTAWKSPWSKDVSFENFCEFILPYRTSIEPLQNWRSTYQEKFQWINDKAKGEPIEEALKYLATDFKKWFVNTYNIESRKEPLPRLGALQLLHRKRGPCEDIADLTAFALRSQGFQVSNDMVTYWATSFGSHFFNSIISSKQEPIRFDVSTPKVSFKSFVREPAKVIRTTYSKQPGTLASFEDARNIPDGFMRTVNYLDVTDEYWQTKDIHCALFTSGTPSQVAYACVFNFLDWRPTWWGKVNNNSVDFSNMCRGAVFLPAYFINGKLQPAGYPVMVGYKHDETVLAPDTINTRQVKLEQQENYLIYRTDKNYQLYYWNNSWKSLGMKKAAEKTTELLFDNVPRNALLLLVPEYSQGKERPFVIMEDGQRLWW